MNVILRAPAASVCWSRARLMKGDMANASFLWPSGHVSKILYSYLKFSYITSYRRFEQLPELTYCTAQSDIPGPRVRPRPPRNQRPSSAGWGD